jgi:hypothetical protein
MIASCASYRGVGPCRSEALPGPQKPGCPIHPRVVCEDGWDVLRSDHLSFYTTATPSCIANSHNGKPIAVACGPSPSGPKARSIPFAGSQRLTDGSKRDCPAPYIPQARLKVTLVPLRMRFQPPEYPTRHIPKDGHRGAGVVWVTANPELLYPAIRWVPHSSRFAMSGHRRRRSSQDASTRNGFWAEQRRTPADPTTREMR